MSPERSIACCAACRVRGIEPYREQILARAAEPVSSAGGFVFNALSATTRGTVLFIFHFVVMLYTMFFFLTDGPKLVHTMRAYLPLSDADKDRMLDKFVSVTRATLKGTILIGLAQGVLGGIAFWAVGIEAAIFWGTVMTVLSIIPGIGGALVWVPAAIILIATGAVWQGIVLALFCGLVVGSVDNLLRPILVGRDTQMHELLIFFSTLGGLLAFGAMGFILGPILAALFLTVWEMFGVAFRGIPGNACDCRCRSTRRPRRHGGTVKRFSENQTPCPLSPVPPCYRLSDTPRPGCRRAPRTGRPSPSARRGCRLRRRARRRARR